jgi:hypothetical protein
MKGVILSTRRARRFGLAVLTGVLFGLFGAAVANADTQSAPASAIVQSSQIQIGHPAPMDWWE